MKFSFEHQEYRDDLAEKLVEERQVDREKAKQTLEDSRKTLEYDISQRINRMLFKLSESSSGELPESLSHLKDPENQKISYEKMAIKDSSGLEHILDIKVTNIQDELPDEVKLIYDMHRLLILEYKLSQGKNGRQFFGGGEGWKDGYNDEHNDRSPLVVVKQYVEFTKHEDLLDQKKITELVKRADTKLEQMAEIKVRGIGNKLCSVIGAYEKGYSGNDSYREPDVTEVEAFDNLQKRYPHQDKEDGFTEKPIPLPSLHSEKLWVNVGGVHFNYFFKPLLVIDKRLERFKGEMKETGVDINSFDDSIHGKCIEFKKDTPWPLVAKYIFDGYHGRLIEIIDPSEKITAEMEREDDIRELVAASRIMYDAGITWDKVPDILKHAYRTFGIPRNIAVMGYSVAKGYADAFREDPKKQLYDETKELIDSASYKTADELQSDLDHFGIPHDIFVQGFDEVVKYLQLEIPADSV